LKRNDHLFQLIKSLTKSEKRFFKIYSSRHVIGDKNNYVALFDVIDKQKVYDEEAIILRFAGEKFVNRLAVAKAYLSDLILKSMNTYHAKNTIDAQLMELLRNISFLFEKNLYTQADKSIRKAKKMALEYQKISILPEIVRWEKKVMNASFYSGKKLTEIEALKEEEKSLLKQLLNLNEFWLLDARLYYQYNLEGIIRTREDLKKIEWIIHSPLLKNEEQALSFPAQKLQYKIFSTYYFILRDFDKCYIYIAKLVRLFENHPQQLKHESLEYVQAVNNLLNMTGSMSKVEETEANIQKLRQMIQDREFQKSAPLQLKLFEAYYYHIINYYRNKKTPESGLKHIDAIEKGLNDYGNKVDEVGKIMLCFHAFQLCYEAEQPQMSLNWIGRILASPESDIHKDIYSFSKILNLLLHYQLNEDGTYHQVIRQTYAFLYRRKHKYKFEQLITNFLRQLTKTADQIAFIQLLENLQLSLDEIAEDPFERKAFAYFDFKTWVNKEIARLKRHQRILGGTRDE